MNAFEVYEMYNALTCHFKRKTYDFFKTNGKVKCSVDAFERNPSKNLFKRLAKHKDPKGLMLCSFISRRSYWLSDLFSPECIKEYTEWKKRQEAITYLISNELETIEDLESEVRCYGNNHPALLKRYMQGKLSFDALCIIVEITRCYSYWDKHLTDDVLWSDVGNKIKKYTPFISYDKVKFKAIIKDKINAYQPTKPKDVRLHNHIGSGSNIRLF